MNQPSPAPASTGDNIIINGRVEGKNFAIGAYAQVNVVEQHFHAEIGDAHLRQMVRSVLQEGRTQLGRLASLGVSSGVAPLTLGAEQLSPHDPFASPISIPPLPPSVQPQELDQTDTAFAAVNQLIEQIDCQIQGGQVQEVIAEGQSLNLVALLLQQGNLALWRFRQGALPLFAEQASLYALAQPQSPPLLAFQTAAKGDHELLRSWVLYQHYRERQPAFMDQPAWEALNQGRWHDVLHDWVAQQRLSGEQAQAEQQYLAAIGEPYNSHTVQTAAREAEWYFSEALKRQPDQSTAMVNLGALLAESALLSYIETGKADRTRLSQAQNLFQQAQVLLEQHPDREGQIALAQCLLYEATSLPPDVQLETVQWAATQVQQMRAALRQEVPTALRLDMAQRNLARRDSSFLDRQKIERARDILVGAGAAATLITLAGRWLSINSRIVEEIKAVPKHPLSPRHLEHLDGNGSSHASSPHTSTPALPEKKGPHAAKTMKPGKPPFASRTRLFGPNGMASTLPRAQIALRAHAKALIIGSVLVLPILAGALFIRAAAMGERLIR